MRGPFSFLTEAALQRDSTRQNVEETAPNGWPQCKITDMGASVVVVDDDDDIAGLLLASFDRAHISAVRARNGDEGVAIVHTERPAVVLLDWMMPIKDGIQTCLEIRSDATLVQPHIIMVTARVHCDDQQHARRCGVDDIIPKPFRPRDLIARVRSVLPD